MSKIAGRKSNQRIVIYPRDVGDFGSIKMSASLIYGHGPEAEKRIERDIEERLAEILADVKRHVDNVHSAYVEFDQEHVCEHCGSVWTETSATYNGGCCDKDEESNPENAEVQP